MSLILLGGDNYRRGGDKTGDNPWQVSGRLLAAFHAPEFGVRKRLMDEIDLHMPAVTEAEKQTALLRKILYWLQFSAAGIAFLAFVAMQTL